MSWIISHAISAVKSETPQSGQDTVGLGAWAIPAHHAKASAVTQTDGCSGCIGNAAAPGLTSKTAYTCANLKCAEQDSSLYPRTDGGGHGDLDITIG